MRDQRNWVPADDGRATMKPYEDTGPGIWVETSGTWQNAGRVVEEKTSGRDRAIALLWRATPVLFLELLITIAIVALASRLGPIGGFGWSVVWVLLLWGGLGLGTYLILSEREQWHSSTGVEHHRIDSATEIAITQIESDRDVRLSALRAYMGMLESKADATEQKQIGGPR